MQRNITFTFLLVNYIFINALGHLRKPIHESLLQPGSKLELTPKNAVAQLDDDGRPIKLIPTESNGSWEYPFLPSNEKRDMSIPRNHILPNGLEDSTQKGTNIYPGTLVSLNGYDYIHSQPRSPPTSEAKIFIPSGSSPSSLSKIDMNNEENIHPKLSSKINLDSTPFAEADPEYDHNANMVTAIPFASSSALQAQPKQHYHLNMKRPTVVLSSEPSGTPSSTLPSLPRNPSDFQLKDLLTLFSLQIPNISLWFSNLGLWNIKFPQLFLSPNFPQMNGFIKYFGSTTKEALNKNISEASKICIPDYQALECPVEWIKKGRFCVASETYTGPCSHIMDFSNYPPDQLSLWASQCRAEWPCKTKASRCPDGINYGLRCPGNWLESNEGCQPGPDYNGQCREPIYPIQKYTENDKKNFEILCDVTWPCITKECEEDFNALCPSNYEFSNTRNICVALNKDGVLCPVTSQDVYHWSWSEKKEWSNRCQVRWPCKKNKPTGGGSLENCDRDYTIPCPKEWENVAETGLCKIPSSFFQKKLPHQCYSFLPTQTKNSNLRKVPNYAAFDYWTTEDKEKFSSLCFVFWPCRNEKMIWNKEKPQSFNGCPTGFHIKREKNNEIVCESASPEKKNSCDATRNFSKMSLNELLALTRLCGYQWNNKEMFLSEILRGADVNP